MSTSLPIACCNCAKKAFGQVRRLVPSREGSLPFRHGALASEHDLEIRTLLKDALTDDINSREVYMMGIQSSYTYEGQEAYDVHQLFSDKS